MIVAPPKAGRRGDVALPSLALDRDARYRSEHERSIARPTPPQTWPACVAFFRDAWEASLPTRMHTRGVEDESALGSPRMAGAMHARIDHAVSSKPGPDGKPIVNHNGWGLTGHDRDGQPRGVTPEGLTRDPFLYYVERMLRGKDEYEKHGALSLIRWAYMGWDVEAAAQASFLTQHADPDTWALYLAGYRALLERTIRTLWVRCQREPERFPVCRQCRHRECICGQRSEAQVNAEEAG